MSIGNTVTTGYRTPAAGAEVPTAYRYTTVPNSAAIEHLFFIDSLPQIGLFAESSILLRSIMAQWSRTPEGRFYLCTLENDTTFPPQVTIGCMLETYYYQA